MPTELLVSRPGDRTWAALRCRGRAVELHVVSAARPDPVERIVRGRVCDVQPGIGAAFVEIGLERPAFLRAADPRDPLKVGRELTVQVVRAPLGEKGARVSRSLRLAGRLLVCRPGRPGLALSGRIERPAERGRLLGLLERCPAGVGWTARTRAATATGEQIADEAARLLERWRSIDERAARTPAPAAIEPEPDLLDRLLRDLPDDETERIVVDTEQDRERVARHLRHAELHCSPPPLVEAYGLDADARQALARRVALPSGGSLVFEQTEALLAVDVNTAAGSALRVNLEAVSEVARRLRLLDIGGTVIVDLLEMAAPEHRLRVEQELRRRLQKDRARTRVVGFSDGRLLHLVRKRRGPGLDIGLLGG